MELYQVDAFTQKRFAGNPAAVCLLDEWLPDGLLQSIAHENNLSETAFVVGSGTNYHLRWFTPVAEVDLCGHATLSAAWVLLERKGISTDTLSFDTRSGTLTVRRAPEGALELDMPGNPAKPSAPPMGLVEALGGKPTEILVATRDHMAVYGSSVEISTLRPNLTALAEVDVEAVIVTAPGEDCDFVSRFFAPRLGIAEDPVTGSAHCALALYWAKRLGKEELQARQLSKRGGELRCRLVGERVRVSGYVTPFFEGTCCVD